MKRKLTLYVEETVIDLARTDGLNLSKTVEDLLSVFLATNNLEAINKKIDDYQNSLNALTERKKIILKNGLEQEQTNIQKKKTWDDLCNAYSTRRKGTTDINDLLWVTAPININRCRILGKEPIEVVNDLRTWYSGVNK